MKSGDLRGPGRPERGHFGDQDTDPAEVRDVQETEIFVRQV